MGLRHIIKLFRSNNVMVYGVKGSGKDMLTGNIIFRRKLPYVSNIDYGGDFYMLDFRKLDLHTTFHDMINGQNSRYVYPYPEKADVYISDTGIYMPAQYNGELNKYYKSFPLFLALCRHLGDCAVHTNTQGFNRPWDKIREQAESYVLCRSCNVFFRKIVVQRVTVYDDSTAAEKKVRPFSASGGLLHRQNTKIAKAQFEAQYGIVKNRLLIYINKSKYNTRYFRDLFMGVHS